MEILEVIGALVVAIGAILLVIGIISIPILMIYGLYLAFSSHIITGLIVLVLEPLPLVVGLGALLGYDIAGAITEFIMSL